MMLIAILILFVSLYIGMTIGMMVQCSNYNSLQNFTAFWCLIAPFYLPYLIIFVAIQKKSAGALKLFLYFDIVVTVFLRSVSDAEFAIKLRREQKSKKARHRYNSQIRENVHSSIVKQADFLVNAA